MTSETKNADVEAVAFFTSIDERKEDDGPTFTSTVTFCVGGCHSVPGFRLDIEDLQGHTIDYIGLGTDPTYVSKFVKKMVQLCEERGLKVV